MEPVILPPYDITSLAAVMDKLDPARGCIKRDAVIESWMKSGAKNKEQREAALKWFLVDAPECFLADDPETKTLVLTERPAAPGVSDGDGDDDGSSSASGGNGYAGLHPRVVGRILLASHEGFRRVAVEGSPDSVLLVKFLKKAKSADSVSAKSGTSEVDVQYVGQFLHPGGKTEFGKSASTKLPVRDCIAGWRALLPFVCVGDAVDVMFDASLGYGERGSHPIPAWAPLYFRIQLRAVSGTKSLAEAAALLEQASGVSREEF
jgi:hypothetical protein